MAKKKQKNTPKVDDKLSGFDIRINEFGEIITTMNIEQLNDFLNHTIGDKKLQQGQEGTDGLEATERGEDGTE